MKIRKSTMALGVLVLLGMVIVSGCGPNITVETPVPTPDIAATVEAAVAAALASQPTPDVATTAEATVATAMASQPTPDIPATVQAAVATAMATQAVPIDKPEPCVSPTIEFTYVPPYGNDYEDLKGRVACVEPADYKVAVYIYVDGGWFNKPFLASPLTTIGSDGAWTTDITLAKYDPRATQIAAFFVRNGYSPPLMEGETMFPEELYKNSVDHVIAHREPGSRTIEFSGHT